MADLAQRLQTRGMRKLQTRHSITSASLIGGLIDDTVDSWCFEVTRDNIRHHAFATDVGAPDAYDYGPERCLALASSDYQDGREQTWTSRRVSCWRGQYCSSFDTIYQSGLEGTDEW
jgi:hypothetical protein